MTGPTITTPITAGALPAGAVALRLPDGSQLVLAEAAARESARQIGVALADLVVAAPAQRATVLAFPRRRVIQPWLQRRRREWSARRQERTMLVILFASFYPLAWIVFNLPTVLLLAAQARQAGVANFIAASLAAAVVTLILARRLTRADRIAARRRPPVLRAL